MMMELPRQVSRMVATLPAPRLLSTSIAAGSTGYSPPVKVGGWLAEVGPLNL